MTNQQLSTWIVRYDGIFAIELSADSHCTAFREWWNSQEERLE